MTSWPARRVGDQILCGRPAPSRGYCSGRLAEVHRAGGAKYDPPPEDGRRKTGRLGFDLYEYVQLPYGLTEDPPGSGTWRPTARSLRRTVRQARPRLPFADRDDYRSRGGASSLVRHPTLPLTRACPVCHVLAVVAGDLLES